MQLLNLLEVLLVGRDRVSHDERACASRVQSLAGICPRLSQRANSQGLDEMYVVFVCIDQVMASASFHFVDVAFKLNWRGDFSDSRRRQRHCSSTVCASCCPSPTFRSHESLDGWFRLLHYQTISKVCRRGSASLKPLTQSMTDIRRVFGTPQKFVSERGLGPPGTYLRCLGRGINSRKSRPLGSSRR